jgi:serine/threonine-protein kinase
LLRQVPPRPQRSEQSAIVPAVPASAAVPTWARLPQQSSRSHAGQRRRAATGHFGLHGRLSKLTGAGTGDRARVVVLVAVAAMVLTVIGSIWWLTIGRYTDAPQLVNMPRAQAEATAARNGFKLIFGEPAFSETAEKDVVLSQDPPFEEQVVKGGTITLVLSRGPERYPVPDVSGMELAAARGEIENANLKFKEGDATYSDEVPKGIVISSDPTPGGSLKRGETVTVTVSKGRAPITVPDLNGKNINEARSILQGLGLNVVEQYKDSDQPADQVIGQSPKSGTGAEKGSEVKLEVSKGPAQVIVPRVIDMPCEQARQTLESLGLRVRIDLNPAAIVRAQNPPENTPVAPQSELVIQCF